MKSDRAFALAAPFIAAALVLLATSKRGPALSPDSAVYLSVADHLANGRGFVQFDGAPYVRWAPLYPWLLSLGPRIGMAAAEVAHGLQPVACGASVALCGVWLRRHVPRAGWRVAALALITLSTIGIESAAFVWAESFDLLLTLGCLLALDAWMDAGRARSLAMATACAALACLDRYASVVLVPVGVAAILFAERPARRTPRMGSGLAAGAFAAGALLPLGLWFLRNLRLGEGLLGQATGGGFSWFALLAQAGNAASHWVSPESSPPWVRVALLAVAASIVAWTLARGLGAAGHAAGRKTGGRAPVLLLLGFLAAHALAVIVGAHAAAVEQVDERYLAPLFAPLVLALAWAASRAAARPAPRQVATSLAVLAGLWIAFTALRTADRERGYLDRGAWGLNNATWERSGVLALVRTSPPRGLVYSNAPDALYALARVEARLSPRLHVYNAPKAHTDDLERFPVEVDSAGAAVLVWFAGVDRPFLAPPEELARRRPVTGRRALPDGLVEAFAAVHRPAAPPTR